MNSPEANNPSTISLTMILKNRWTGLALILLGISVASLGRRACGDAEMEKWVKAGNGDFLFQLADGDILESPPVLKMLPVADVDSVLVLKLNEEVRTASSLAEYSQSIYLEIIIADFPEKSFQGRLKYISAAMKKSKALQDTTSNAIVEVLNENRLLKPGMTVLSAVLKDSSAQAVFLEDSAIFEMHAVPVVFLRSMWPEPCRVLLGPRDNGDVMIVEGINAGEEVALLPPQHLKEVKRLGQDAYRNAMLASREGALNTLLGRLKSASREVISDSLRSINHTTLVDRSAPANSTVADGTVVIDSMLFGAAHDSNKGIAVGRIRIGPGEGGKLAPLSPEALQERKRGEKISVSAPAVGDTSADTLNMKGQQVAEPESSEISKKPPLEF